MNKLTTLAGSTGLLLSLLAAPARAADAKPPNDWFKATRVAEGVWVIDDHGSDNMYLVEGEKKALLIDTGLGVGRLSDFVKTLTRRPVIVVNTHGHPDHSGGNYMFPAVFAAPRDFEAIEAFSSEESRNRTIGQMTKGASASGLVTAEEAARMPAAKLEPVKDGDVFDLGGRKLEVIEQPGHTPGEIVLLDAAHRLVFGGDSNNSLVWLFLGNSRPLAVYLESLKKLKARGDDFETILPGHGPPLPKAHLDDQIACVESILDGSCKDEPYKSFVGDARLCKHGGASVAFNPGNLRAND